MMINNNMLLEKSATVTINSLAQQKMALGIDVYNLSAGEPILPPCKLLMQAVVRAMQQGKTLYPPVFGISELRRLAAEWMNSNYDCSFVSENCLVTNGGKLGIYLLMQLLIQNGDEVIIASPYWVSYPSITRLFGGVPVIVETKESESWKLTADILHKSCSSRTRILMLNNGANPTGALYSKHELESILGVAKDHNLLVISDEVYSGLTYDNQSYVSCASFSSYKDNVIVIQSCSKNFSMTGWRVGFVFGDKNIIDQVASLVSQSTSGVTTISQWAAVAVFKQSKKIIASVRMEMQKRRDIIINALNANFGIKVNPPPSSLYVFISLNDLGVTNITSEKFCLQLLEDANVALVPGAAFGKEGYVRLSFGACETNLRLGIKALAEYVSKNSL